MYKLYIFREMHKRKLIMAINKWSINERNKKIRKLKFNIIRRKRKIIKWIK